MSVIDKLATSLSRRDELPNKELAQEIVGNKDAAAVKELVQNLRNKNKGIQGDRIKTLYEVAETEPTLVAIYVNDILALLHSSNNRMQWGAMTALSMITNEVPKDIYNALGALGDVAEKGSVITKDHYVAILVKLGKIKEYTDDVLVLLNEQILNSPVNQLPTYAENALPIIDEQHKALFIKTFTTRLADVELETKRKRLEKALKKLHSGSIPNR